MRFGRNSQNSRVRPKAHALHVRPWLIPIFVVTAIIILLIGSMKQKWRLYFTLQRRNNRNGYRIKPSFNLRLPFRFRNMLVLIATSEDTTTRYCNYLMDINSTQLCLHSAAQIILQSAIFLINGFYCKYTGCFFMYNEVFFFIFVLQIVWALDIILTSYEPHSIIFYFDTYISKFHLCTKISIRFQCAPSQ